MRRTPPTRTSRRLNAIIGACLALAVALVGCGGGGGGGTSTTTTPTTTSTAGANLPANTILYGEANGTDSNFDLNAISPDGTNGRTYLANLSGKILLFAVNPAVEDQFFVAADLTGDGFFGIYKTTGLDLDTAIQVVAPQFSYVASLAVTMNGGNVVFTAADALGVSNLYSIPASGGTATKLALADGSAISPADNDTIVYVGAPAGVGDFNQVFTRSLAAGAGGSSTQITTEAINHLLPTFSRDGKTLAWWEESDINRRLAIYKVSTAATIRLSNPANLYPQATAFSSTGTRVVTVAADDAGRGGILTQLTDGTQAPIAIRTAPALLGNYGVYWTDASGRLAGGSFGGSAVGRRLKLK